MITWGSETEQLQEIIELIRKGSYEFTEHALSELTQDGLEEEDILTAIEYGVITKRQRDRQNETKYVYTIKGYSDTGIPIYAAGKIIRGFFKVFKIITAKEDTG